MQKKRLTKYGGMDFFYKIAKMGITGKLWFLIRNWFLDSSCCILLDAKYSDKFPIGRSIKQGGLLSMFFYTVFNKDLHEFVDQGDGILVNNVNYCSLTLADDTVLASLTKDGIHRMMQRAHTYSRCWRLNFSPSKTSVVVFGESKRVNDINSSMRTWALGDSIVSEQQHVKHLGITLCAYANSTKRTNDACSKSKSMLGTLATVGVRPNGMNPMYSSKLWNKICIPACLFGCEVWHNLSSTEMVLLERAQKYAAKLMQGFHVRTHDEIARSMLGWHSMEARIHKAKLIFLRKITSLPSNDITKQLFLYRLTDFMLINDVNPNKGFIREVWGILRYYGLCEYLRDFFHTLHFPPKLVWRSIVNDAINAKQNLSHVNGLLSKSGTSLYLIAQPEIKISILYKVAAKYSETNNNIIHMARLLTIPDTNNFHCHLCKVDIVNTAVHLLTLCPFLNDIRNIMWNEIIDAMSVEHSVSLHNKTEEQQTAIMLGAKWDVPKSVHEQLIVIVAKYLGYQCNQIFINNVCH